MHVYCGLLTPKSASKSSGQWVHTYNIGYIEFFSIPDRSGSGAAITLFPTVADAIFGAVSHFYLPILNVFKVSAVPKP